MVTASNCPQEPVLQARSLKKAFGGQTVLKDLDFVLRRGEVALLRGENGSGKTTLLNILSGNIEPDEGTIRYLIDGTPRVYTFPRRVWQDLNPLDHFAPEFVAREGVGRTWQDVRLFSSQSLRDNIGVSELRHPGENPIIALLSPSRSFQREQDVARRADQILATLGLKGREDSSADKISLGQSKRVAIARCVAAGARVLFLDEPLAGLDGQGIEDVLSLIRVLVRERGVTLVIVEHVFNQPCLRDLVTTDWLLEGGHLVTSPIDSSAHLRGMADARTQAWPDRLAGVDSDISEECLERNALLTRIRCPGTKLGAPVLEIRNLVIRRGPRVVIGLDAQGSQVGFNLTLYDNQLAVLQAPNGWGKSSLFAAILGMIVPDAGGIWLRGVPLAGLAPWERARRGLHGLPSRRDLFSSLRVSDVLRLSGRTPSDAGVGALADRPCSSLSGGERQRVALEALPVGNVAVYDEPFFALDERNTADAISRYIQGRTSAQLLLMPGELSRPHRGE
jgi:ABC-type branched-subunit amino acid transport system ATPase component